VQEPQLSPFDSENLTPAERRALRRSRTRRAPAFSLGVGASVLALFAVGCPEPADLANPGDYPTATAGTNTGTAGGATAGTGGSASPSAACESTCMASIIGATCKGCHGKAIKLAGTLDLETAGYTGRLKDKPAEHPLLDASAMCPTGDLLIDSAAPANSWLLKKVSNQQGTCGAVMPSPPLTSEEVACVQTYVTCVAGGT